MFKTCWQRSGAQSEWRRVESRGRMSVVVPVSRNAQKLQSKQTNTSAGLASVFVFVLVFVFATASAVPGRHAQPCRTGEHRNLCWFAHVYVQLAAPVVIVGSGWAVGPMARLACFAVCFWQAKHKAQHKSKRNPKTKTTNGWEESILYEICMATLPTRKTIAKSSFPSAAPTRSWRMFTTGNSTNVRLAHTHTHMEMCLGCALKIHKPMSENKSKTHRIL